MTILVIPWFGCNMRCAYCFARTHTHVPQKIPNINFSKIEEQLRKLIGNNKGRDVCLHGGEPLALPKYLLEAFFKMLYEVNGRSAIQTNLYNLDDDHIRMFKRYNVSIGASIDGPPELNILRGFPEEPEKQKVYLKRVYENLDKLVSEKISVSIISVLHKVNAGTKEARERMKKWFLELADKGIRCGRTNPLFDPFESAHVVKWRLTPEELAEAWVDFFRFFRDYPDLHWSPYRDVIDVLLGQSVSVCVFGKCDIFASKAAIAIYPDGSLGVCDRYYGIGIIRRQDPPLNVRYEILPKTECRGCKYWKVCRGGCPLEAPFGEWRRKTYFCKAYYALFEEAERYLKALMPNIVLAHEVPYDWLERGHNPFLGILHIKSAWRASHKRFEPYKSCVQQPKYLPQTGIPHGDRGHGDWTNHGDSCSPVPLLKRPEPKSYEHTDGSVRHSDRPHGDWHNHGDSG